ncbi:MAG: FAD:protein FMN transferase [Prevotellaceae bacterium]|jgi:thiamine biosynthesis lipoprotein|nr:FAD:protein FMN transferase [Prevotellaceae bacterium]
MDKKNRKNFLLLGVLLLGTIFIIVRHNRPVPYHTNTGLVFGTVYKITYQHADDLAADIEQELKRFDGSLSTFNDTSTISRINRNEVVAHADTLFLRVLRRSMEVSQQTDGAFDITVAPLVNAWGFGFKQNAFPDSAVIDSLRQLIGYTKIALTPDGRVQKQDPRIMLDCSAIAKGYAVDVIADLLARKGAANYMVDIGGEVVVHGVNAAGAWWRIGINKPVDDSLSVNNELQTILQVSNVGIATSGNYRNFYYRGGRKYAHTIDPHTGYPVQHSILSATVVAHDCMTADAYATAFMVMGLEPAKAFLANHPELEAYFIYADDESRDRVFHSPGMNRYIAK